MKGRPNSSCLVLISCRSVCDLGVSYATARHLAAEYHVSVTAALAQMARTAPGLHAIVLWRLKQKPTELRISGPEDQPTLFADLTLEVPHPKLHVEWCLAGPGTPFIPRDKSVPDDSSIGRLTVRGYSWQVTTCWNWALRRGDSTARASRLKSRMSGGCYLCCICRATPVRRRWIRHQTHSRC